MPGLPFRASDTQQRLELENGWEFLPDPTAKLRLQDLDTAQPWRAVRVGLSWNAQFDDLRDYMGAAWYRTRFEAPLSRETKHVLIKFGAVDYFCEVYVNGNRVGEHEGGYTPFSFDISNVIHLGINELALRVIDPPMDEAQNQELFPEMLYNEIPHGKQNWYIQNSGIWQGVRLEFTPAVYVDRTDVTPQITGEFRIDLKLAGDGLKASPEQIEKTRIRAAVHDNVGRLMWESLCPLISQESLSIHGKVQQPKLWGPNSAVLYTLDISLEGAINYRRRTRFGFRELAAQNGKLLLNGKPFFMMAALDQDFYPETIHSPASQEFVLDMMLKAKRLGINVLRCHLKVAHPVYLDVADELGMLVWAELPSWSDSWFPADHFSEKAARRGEQMFAEIMLRDWNHPCLVVQTIMNESWGINLKDPAQRTWLKHTFERIKSVLAPLGRLVVDNSACEGNFHVKSDIDDFHNYYSQPDQADLWDKFVEEFASRPAWSYSPYGDAERTGEEPLLVSEFGNWGLPKLPTELPWWFNNSFGEREVTRPEGVLERFDRFRFDRIFKDFSDLAEASQWHQFSSLKYEIESMRSRPSLQGYCITGMTDVHWEVNGLLDMWRNEKVFADEMAKLQQPDLLVAQFATRNFYSGEQLEVPLVLSHFSDRDLTGARVRWTTDSGESGSFVIDRSIVPGSVEVLKKVSFPAPVKESPMREGFTLELRAKTGLRISENSYGLFIYPHPRPQTDIALLFHDPLGTAAPLEKTLRAAGYAVSPLTSTASPSGLLISTCLDEPTLSYLFAGGRGILLADSPEALGADCVYKCTERADTWLDGRWFSNYNWIIPGSGPYRDLALHRVLAFESRFVVPRYVIENVDAGAFADVLAGITLGWLNLNNALTLQTNVKAGKLLITTFRFDKYGADPYATHLLDAYVAYVDRREFLPSSELPHRVAVSR